MRAVGDCVLVERHDALELIGPRGPLASWHLGTSSTPAEIGSYAALADPPRLAVVGETTLVAPELRDVQLIDVATGDVQRTVRAPTQSAVAFTPAGDVLLCNGTRLQRGITVIDDDGRVFTIADDGPPLVDVAFAPFRSSRRTSNLRAAGVAYSPLINVPDEPADEPRIARVEIYRDDRSGELGQATSFPVITRAVCVDDDGRRAAVLAWRDAQTIVELWDLVRGRRTGSLLHAGGRAPMLMSLWASADLSTICALDQQAMLHTARLRPTALARVAAAPTPAPTWMHTRHVFGPTAILDDVDSDVVIAPGGVGRPLRVCTLGGDVVGEALGATLVCLTGFTDVARVSQQRAVALRDGAVYVVDRRSPDGGRLVEGPGGLIDIAPHPRGVIAVDDDGRAHVIAIDIDIDVAVDGGAGGGVEHDS